MEKIKIASIISGKLQIYYPKKIWSIYRDMNVLESNQVVGIDFFLD